MSRKTLRAVAALSVDLAGGGAPTEFRLIPDGPFRAADGSGRPEEVEAWRLDPATAAAIVVACASRQSAFVIDYEHQTLRAAENGKPAPASGWFKAMEWREGDGLYAVGVEWTAEAAAMIAAKQYRYISPVFAWDKRSGAVLAIAHVALTNTPGLDGLTDLAGAAALSALISEETPHMDELLEQLRWMLNLPVGATAEEVAAHLQKLIDQLKAGPAQAAAGFSLADYLAATGAEIASLKAAAPDPAKYVEVVTLSAVQGELATARTELAALQAERHGAEVDRVVVEALAAGKLTPATEAWARDLGKKDLAALNAFLTAAPVVLSPGTQTGGKPPAGAPANLTEAQLAVCSQLGIAPEEYAQTLAATAA